MAARVAVLVVARSAGELPRPGDDPVFRRLDLGVAERQQEDPGALPAILLPRRRGLDEAARHRERRLAGIVGRQVAQGLEPQLAVLVLGGAGEEEELTGLRLQAG